jgi:hypothetical protein
LAQQLAGALDSGSMMNLARSREGGQPGFPFFPPRRGAVGYQPVIITIPEGTSMSATAVVSADRRYVRVTASPLFSGIAEVNTFNFVSGDSGEGQGGTGGQGYGGGGMGGGGMGF